MSEYKCREVRLANRPAGVPQPADFAIENVVLPELNAGEVRVRNDWMSVDPYMRGRMRDQPSYIPPFAIGRPLEGGAVGTVIQSNEPGLAVGDVVLSMLGWRQAFNASGKVLRKLDTSSVPPEAHLGVAGLTGMTAYVGLLQVAGIKAGEVLFVSAAAGAVGSVVCQIGKLKNATVIGSAGGPEKCAFLREIGVDHVIDYKAADDLTTAVAQAAPNGIDVYFDNVGGRHLDAALTNAKPFGRVALCGMISHYNEEAHGAANLFLAITKRLRLEGFIVSDYRDQMPSFLAEMSSWLRSGQVISRQTVVEGIENAPAAFVSLFSGANLGKMLVKLG